MLIAEKMFFGVQKSHNLLQRANILFEADVFSPAATTLVALYIVKFTMPVALQSTILIWNDQSSKYDMI